MMKAYAESNPGSSRRTPLGVQLMSANTRNGGNTRAALRSTARANGMTVGQLRQALQGQRFTGLNL